MLPHAVSRLMQEGGAEGALRGLQPSIPSALWGEHLSLGFFLCMLRALKCALGHLWGAAACNPYNPILMNLHAQEQTYLGEMKKMKQTLPSLAGWRGME